MCVYVCVHGVYEKDRQRQSQIKRYTDREK